MKMLVKIDHENNAEAFWDHVDTAAYAPAALQMLSFGGADEVEISAEDADDLLKWCQRAPGWAGGPAYAPHPILIMPAG